METKIAFLELILERKDVLFSPFSSNLRDKRSMAWRDVDANCNALGLNMKPPDKTFTYLRDTVWPNFRRYALARRDKRKRVETAGGKPKMPSRVDELVLQIIDTSPITNGVSSMDMLDDPVDDQKTEETVDETVEDAGSTQPVPVLTPPRKRRFEEKLDLELEFYRLRNDNLRLQNELLGLKIAKLRRMDVSETNDLWFKTEVDD